MFAKKKGEFRWEFSKLIKTYMGEKTFWEVSLSVTDMTDYTLFQVGEEYILKKYHSLKDTKIL